MLQLKITTLLTLLLNIIFAQTNVKSPISRIVGGVEVSPKFQYPFIVSLQKSEQHFCGGTLISNIIVLTAAHCALSYDTSTILVKQHRHDLTLTDTLEFGLTRLVINKIVHEGYDKSILKHDIALLILNKLPNNLANQLNRIQLDNGQYKLIKSATLIGWGYPNLSGPVTDKLMKINLPITNNQLCIKQHMRYNYTVNIDLQLCAGYPEGGRDMCDGDSGGPLFIEKDNKFTLVGIVSGTQKCALPDLAGLYTRVSSYVDWIMKANAS